MGIGDFEFIEHRLTAKEARKLLAGRIGEIIRGEGTLFEIQNNRVEGLAYRYAGIILNKKLKPNLSDY